MNQLLKNPYPTLLVSLFGMGMAVAMGVLAAQQEYTLLTLCYLAFFGIFVFVQPKIGFYLFCFFACVQVNYINRHFVRLPSLVGWLPHFLLLFTLAAVVWQKLIVKKERVVLSALLPGRLPWVAGVAGLVFVISAVLNDGLNLGAALALRQWFVFFGTIILVHLIGFTGGERERFIQLILGVAFLQVPVTLIQRFVLVGPFGQGDIVSGTFTSDDFLVFFQTLCILLVIHYWVNDKARLTRWHPVLHLVSLLFPLVLANSKAGWAYLLVVVLWLLLRSLPKFTVRGTIIMLLFGGLILAGTFSFNWVRQQTVGDRSVQSSLSYFTDPQIVLAYLFDNPEEELADNPEDARAARGTLILIVHELVAQRPMTLLFGYGPGSFSDSRVATGSGSFAVQYADLNVDRGQIAKMLGELGWLGLGILFWLLLEMYFSFGRNGRYRGLSLALVFQSVLLLVFGQLIFVSVLGSPLIVLSLTLLGIQSSE